MNIQRVLEFISRPVFISLAFWALISVIIPPLFPKYTFNKIRDEFTDYGRYYYYDLDNDGVSEKISLDLSDAGITKLIFSGNNRIIEQYNLKYHSTLNNGIFTGDYNHDGYLECYIFTGSTDSIFLNVIDPIKSHTIRINQRFVDFRRNAPASTDGPFIIPVGMFRGKNRSYSDFVFIITTGFSKQPRNIYRYSPVSDSLVESPESSASITGCIASDICGDSLPEFILQTMAPGNFDENALFSDQYAWLMALNYDLDFVFSPVRFREYPSSLMALPLKFKNKSRLVLFHDYNGTDSLKSAFFLYDTEGHKLREMPVEGYEYIHANIIANHSLNGTFYFIKNRNCEIEEIDTAFRIVNKLVIPGVRSCRPIIIVDADCDGDQEYIFQGRDNKSFIITQHNFRHPVIYEYEHESSEPVITQVFRKENKPCLYLQFDNYGTYVRYFRNPFYLLKYPFYLALFPIILLIVIAVTRILEYRINLKRETEKEIADLQMKAIKNQVDPHFTMNMLNAIGSMYATEKDSKKADYIFGKYARLIRQTVISSDQVIITLQEELDFIKNYIELERFRCGYSFNYALDIGKDVDTILKIPGMLVYTFVENAIKYGVRNREEGGFLKIAVKTEDKTCIVIVEDNGPGLVHDNSPERGTGKGLHILNEMIDLYHRLEKIRITYVLQNIYNEYKKVIGTQAVIRIPLKVHLP